MGRSKFPGKPTKHVNRTRVNVLPGPTSTTVGESSVNMTVDSEEDSKKVDNIPEDELSIPVNTDHTCKSKINRINRRRRKTLSNKRSPAKRNVLITPTTKKTLTPKINLVTHVSRRTRSKVKSRRSVRSFSTLRKVGNGKHPGKSLRDSNNLVGKFILPSRSVHSSRVIKPNKRFINVESPDSRTFKKKVLPKKQNVKCNEAKTKCKTRKLSENVCEETVSPEESAENADSENSQVPCAKGKPLLREARLQVGSKNTLSPDGPFSLTTNVGTPPGYMSCGVCGAVRYHRMMKQVKKFNIYSCESCRKFISKMIKRQKCKSINTTLICQDGQGTCIVSSIVRNQNPNLTSRTRCSACWLKMCLRSFQLPLSLRNCLVQLLPKHMQDNDSLFGGSSFPLQPWPANVENKTLNADNKQHETKPEDVKSPTCVAAELKDTANVRQRPIRLKQTRKDDKPAGNLTARGVKRQKIDLKGPRVKHVCRSASIVLGQPLATFPSGQPCPMTTPETAPPTDPKIAENKPAEVEEARKDSIEVIIQEPKPIEPENAPDIKPTEEIKSVPVLRNTGPKTEIHSVVAPRREKLGKNPVPTTATDCKTATQKKAVNKSTGICIDFWESYDPDEICKNGFCIIGSEPLPMHAICFLCGSGGREPLLHCSLCCEPYHPFCLEQVPSDITNNNQRFNWLCPRCTTCNACGQMDRQKINCQKCHKDYHLECFNDKWRTNDRPLVCSNCLRCKSCGSVNITKFVGNIPLCISCFKLRKKGNFCPLCQKCYDENDYESKMMECNKCKKWIHARCEGLSDEHYQILSLLPESVEYQCHTCCNQSTPIWRQAIQLEMKSCFNNVLRLLSKNRIARNLIKWSPVKAVTSVKALGSAKKLQFYEEQEDIDFEAKSCHIETPKRFVPKETVVKSKDCESPGDNIQAKLPLSPTMVVIKNKLNSTEYMTLREFNQGMEQALCNSDELLSIYHSIMKRVFPWFDPSFIDDTLDSSVCDSRIETQESIKEEVAMDVDYKYVTTNITKDDTRVCILCKGLGDGLAHQESRLLYCGHNEWIHANCALWSSEVYEEIDGSLQNVPSAISRGRSMRCGKCKHKGASVGCCLKGCYETYHFRCAQQARCYFLHDKNVYCSSHDLESKTNILTTPTEFHINRSVYIELDKKKKKYLEPEKVHFMVGSLSVSNLGKIVPILSDSSDSLLPTGFICSRLFWSINEPWKLVPYIITTSVLNTNSINTTIDKNFTIDHTLPKQVVEKKIKELGTWFKELEKDKSDLEDDDDDEPQNVVDMLPPELMNDDIFEVLPHDLLDGISVQDMLMSYEELLNMDFKNAEISCSDNIINNENLKKPEEEECDYDQCKSGRELKRSKSEVFSQISELSKARSQQRSCSLTFSCKMDNSLSPVMKKRKINQINRDNNIFLQLLQVDGGADSSGSECGSPTHEMEDVWSSEMSEEPVTCEKCQCTYRTAASYKRHLETCDALFTSESDSEEQSLNNSLTGITEQNSIENTSIIVKINEQEPQVIASYESYSTYHTTQNEVHSTILNTQTYVTSESTSEMVSVPENPTIYYPSYPQQIVEQKPVTSMIAPQQNIGINQINPVSLNPAATITISQNTVEDCTSVSHPTTTIPMNQSHTTSYCVNQTPICVNQANSMSNLISVDNGQSMTINPTMNQQISINPSGSIAINQPIEIQPQQMTIQQVPYSHDMNILNLTPQNQITIDAKMLTAPNMCNSVVTQTVVPQNQWVKPMMKPTLITQKAIRPRARPTRSLAAKRPATTARLPNGTTVVLPQTNNANTSVIFQHLPSTNMVPAFMDQFQQQSGQNLQYVATLAPQMNQPQLVQLQPENNFLSIMPGVQPTMIIQQPRVMADQLIVDSNGSMIWATQPVQPIYYGFETIVQNTVMQSQQFLPTTVPGVLTTNSSYSATTQVFQTSKLEPVLDVSQGSFVLVNNCPGQILNSQPMQSVQVPHTATQNMATASVVQSKPNIWKFVEQPIVSEAPTLSAHLQIKPLVAKTHPSNSITLPVAPFVPEQGIPTNIVTPTPKQTTTTQVRPMNRVLPMQTNSMRELKKQPIINEKLIDMEKNIITDDIKFVVATEKPQKVQILNDIQIKSPTEVIKLDVDLLKRTIEPIKSEPLKPAMDCFQLTVKTIKPELTNPAYVSIKPAFDVVKPAFDNVKPAFNNAKPAFDNVKPAFNNVKPTFDNAKLTFEQPKAMLELPNPAYNQVRSAFDPIKPEEPVKSAFELVKPAFDSTKHNIDVKPLLDENKPLLEMTRPIQEIKSEKIRTFVKSESQNLKLVFQKQDTEGVYKISNSADVKITPPPEIPSKPSKPKMLTSDKGVLPKKEGVLLKVDELEKKNKLPSITQDENFRAKMKCEENKNAMSGSRLLALEPRNNKEKLNGSNNAAILYTVETQDGFRYSSTSLGELWGKVFEAVQNARVSHNMTPLPTGSLDIINNLQLLGLKTNGLKYLIEQLPGASKCTKYKPTFHIPVIQEDSDLDIVDHTGGAVRCVIHAYKGDEHVDMFGWLASKHRDLENYIIESEMMPRRGSMTNLPMAMRFRQLKTTSKISVGVYRSGIHGRGLFALRNFEAGEMVIEYSGEVIRSILTDKREKYYNSKGIGCYMFRIDDNLVIDATMKGNAARFINHSCDPNCYSKVVEIHGHKHIIIFALRRIYCQEELTYDYKFPFEEDKIPCTCGARKCRKFLN